MGELRRQKYNLLIRLFYSNNKLNNQLRTNLTLELYNELLDWISEDNNNIGIFDATNCSKEKNYYLI